MYTKITVEESNLYMKSIYRQDNSVAKNFLHSLILVTKINFRDNSIFYLLKIDSPQIYDENRK